VDGRGIISASCNSHHKWRKGFWLEVLQFHKEQNFYSMGFSLPCCFSFFLLLLLLFPTDGQTYKNIYLGSSLNADNNSSSWSSPSGHFAFGFQQAGDAGFLLAIWFNKIPERTIVWSADRNNPAQRGSRECSSTDGQLVLDDKQPRMTAM
jgi:hypothetical protein